MPSLALTDLLGSPVYDNAGEAVGKVREVAVVPQDNSSQILGLVVKTRGGGDRLLVTNSLYSINGGARAINSVSDWITYTGGDGMLLLGRDLLDQQIIDVHGRKVVRVNDVDIHHELGHDHVVLKLGARRCGGPRSYAAPAEGSYAGGRACICCWPRFRRASFRGSLSISSRSIPLAG